MSQSETKTDDAGTQAANGAAGSDEHEEGFSLRNHIREEWRPTVFVAACVTILHLWLGWFNAINGYAFLAVSNLVAAFAGATTEPESDAVAVVRIDEETFRARYGERSPLDRCVLSSQIAAIYAAQPHIVVIDLDLSPVDWTRLEATEAERERNCQARLEETLERGSDEGARTVLMKPFDSVVTTAVARSAEWQQQLEGRNGERDGGSICFGDAKLPVSHGIAIGYFTDEHTMYAAASRPSAACGAADATALPTRDRRMIDVKAYARKLRLIPTSWTDTPMAGAGNYGDGDLTATLVGILPAPTPDDPLNRVVFFGAGYGQEDTFLTPVGTLYGVEVHAAAFWSHRYSNLHEPHLFAFAIDVGIALLFGIIIVYCWTHYFAWRTDRHPGHEQLASIWVLIMLGGLLLAIALTTVFAYVLLRYFGIWLSPLPLAVGMLIESCMAGSIAAAVHKLHRIQVHAPGSVPDSHPITKVAAGVKAAVWVLTLVIALGLVFH